MQVGLYRNISSRYSCYTVVDGHTISSFRPIPPPIFTAAKLGEDGCLPLLSLVYSCHMHASGVRGAAYGQRGMYVDGRTVMLRMDQQVPARSGETWRPIWRRYVLWTHGIA